MARHTCHAHGCNVPCAPRFLMCPPHWRMVPRDIQSNVYLAVGRRGPYIDETWAPWWRAAHRAIAHVALQEGIFTQAQHDDFVIAEDAVADQMED